MVEAVRLRGVPVRLDSEANPKARLAEPEA
jgi:hypothetical protein